MNSMTLQNPSSAPPANGLQANGEDPLKWVNVLSYQDLSDQVYVEWTGSLARSLHQFLKVEL